MSKPTLEQQTKAREVAGECEYDHRQLEPCQINYGPDYCAPCLLATSVASALADQLGEDTFHFATAERIVQDIRANADHAKGSGESRVALLVAGWVERDIERRKRLTTVEGADE